ncbi:putative Ig domain-containing protein [Curtobacterium sp. MCJR17_020]|uniref:putative Ig domain-containing protein n=1 Tax=Curtobacterium sp. MCJR17_020 TaxID=2175619 RepID=UPI000DAA674E|nr:putative Ig domain-containing protein [Curtobacterium sp. MCJR17_020]WIE72978.1 putative Ig domain-containing protein [Curtobacterium sp. MCJR17_020]
MRHSASTVRHACAVGTTAALVALTTGLGLVTATAAHADPASNPTTSTATPAPAATDAPAPTAPPTANPSEPTAAEPSDPTSPTPSPDAAPTTTEPSNDAATPTASEPDRTATADPADAAAVPTATPSPTSAPTAQQAVDPAVTITGDTEVGSVLTAVPVGFDEDGAFRYVWTQAGSTTVLATSGSYTIDAAQAGERVSVQVTGALPDGSTATVTATSAPVTQDPVFVDAAGTAIAAGADAGDPLALETTAGDPFSYTFRAQGSPAPTYALAWYDGDDDDDVVMTKSQAAALAPGTSGGSGDSGWTIGFGFQPDDTDEEFGPDIQLPDGITFDAATGELSGTATTASWYQFAITATSGTESVTQYVELTVDPAAAYGVQVFTLDAESIDAPKKTMWIIGTDGTVLTVKLTTDEDGSFGGLDVVDGGRPTVAQGGTLVVSGNLVDRFGNPIDFADEDGNPVWTPIVTSDVASDVIAPYTEFDAESAVGVTFPHASTHTLTVGGEGLQSTSFPVDVRPVVSTVSTVSTAPTVAVGGTAPTSGQLAYTGSDATGALPWAVGLVLVGAGLIGARAVRRRRAAL